MAQRSAAPIACATDSGSRQPMIRSRTCREGDILRFQIAYRKSGQSLGFFEVVRQNPKFKDVHPNAASWIPGLDDVSVKVLCSIQ
jgi:hypothetical protein